MPAKFDPLDDDETIDELVNSVDDDEELAVEEVTEVAVTPAAPEDEPMRGAVTGAYDDVYLTKCVVKNMYNRKSLTVHHLQRRLWELGYKGAIADRDGYYGDLTIAAVAAYQADQGLELMDGTMDAETFMSVFHGDSVVVPHLEEAGS